MAAPKTGPDPGRAGAAGRSLFGLNEDEMGAFAEAFATLGEPLGLDGRRIVGALARGQTLSQALNLPKGLAELLYGRAHSLFNAGRHDRAEPLFRALCALDALEADHWVGYGLCVRQRGADAEAGLAFAAAAALRPAWAVPHFHAAQLALSGERWAEAARHLDAFHDRDDAQIPHDMRRQAERQSRALDLRTAPPRDPPSRDTGP